MPWQASDTFKGYGSEQGYDFLRNAIVDYYKRNGVDCIEPDEVFVSDGAKSDTGTITDLFAQDNVILIPDPVYPVYVDTNIMNGRNITYIDANAEKLTSCLCQITTSMQMSSISALLITQQVLHITASS